MENIYKQLSQYIKEGKKAALISEYTNSGILKSIVSEENKILWNNLENNGECLTVSEENDKITMAEYCAPKPRLIILGGGHIALPLCSFGSQLGFDITVFDDRLSFANAGRFPSADNVICDSFTNIEKRLKIRKTDYIVIVTRGHRHDVLCLRSILEGESPYYLGMIGSKRRIGIIRKQLSEETGEADKLDKLHAPIGLSIGAVTPEEIAVSILAEIIQKKRLGVQVQSEPSKKADLENSPDMELLEWLSENNEEGYALATIISTNGSTPREKGAKMAILKNGQIVGSIGGGCAEAEVIRRALTVMEKQNYCIMDIDMTDSAEEDGMVCGGNMKVLVEAL